MSEAKKCETCEWWKDYKNRVYAKIDGVVGKIHPGTIELRLCRYSPPPTADAGRSVYTNAENVCSGWEAISDE